MHYPELSLPTRSLRERFLNLAEIIVRKESASLKTWGSSPLVFRWIPQSQNSFTDPIALNRVALSHAPDKTERFTVVSSEFEILGDSGMSFVVSRQMKEADFPNDEWNQMVYSRIATSYQNHVHAECLPDIPPETPKITAEFPSFKIVDKRIR